MQFSSQLPLSNHDSWTIQRNILHFLQDSNCLFPRSTSCPFPVSLAGHTFELFAFSSAIINILILAVYFAVFIILKARPTSSQFKRVFRSLPLTVIFVLFGWVTSTFWNIVNLLLVTDPFLFQLFSIYSGIPIQCSLSSNIFVFYVVKWMFPKPVENVHICLPAPTTVKRSIFQKHYSSNRILKVNGFNFANLSKGIFRQNQ